MSQGYTFVTAQDNPSTPIDPATCAADGTCGSGQTIDYAGTDGNDYSATLPAGNGIPPVPPFSGIGIGTSTALTVVPSSPATGQPVTFTATMDAGSLATPGTVSFVSDLSGHDTTLCAGVPVTSVDDTVSQPGVISPVMTLNTATCSWTFTTAQAPVVYATYYPPADSSYYASQGSLSVDVTNQAATTTTVAGATADFSGAAQNVSLSATVSSTSAVSEGAVTFTVLDASKGQRLPRRIGHQLEPGRPAAVRGDVHRQPRRHRHAGGHPGEGDEGEKIPARHHRIERGGARVRAELHPHRQEPDYGQGGGATGHLRGPPPGSAHRDPELRRLARHDRLR